jgi:hypothetical protein
LAAHLALQRFQARREFRFPSSFVNNCVKYHAALAQVAMQILLSERKRRRAAADFPSSANFVRSLSSRCLQTQAVQSDILIWPRLIISSKLANPSLIAIKHHTPNIGFINVINYKGEA